MSLRLGNTLIPSVAIKTSGDDTPTDTWNWMGKNPVKLYETTPTKVYLKDTGYATWTPSTSNGTIVSASTQNISITNPTDYDYVTIATFHSHFDYTTLPANTYMLDNYQIIGYTYGAYVGSRTQYNSHTATSIGGTSLPQNGGTHYYNSSGTESYSTSGTSYGVYTSFPGITHYTDYIRITIPAISARCSTSYFSTDAAAAVNQNTSYYEVKYEIWKVDKNSGISGAQTVRYLDVLENGIV